MTERPTGAFSGGVFRSGVFEVVRAIPEVGAVPGDRIVVRPDDPERSCSLVRRLPPSAAAYAVDSSIAQLIATNPATSDPAAAGRYFRQRVLPAIHRGRLTLI